MAARSAPDTSMPRTARRIKTTPESAPALDQPTEVTPSAIYGEIRDFVRTHERRRRQQQRAKYPP